MDWLTFIAELARALAWPVVVGVGLWMFGGELVKLLKEITKIKFGNLEVERQIERADVQLTIAEAKQEPIRATVAIKDDDDKMTATAAVGLNLTHVDPLLALSEPTAAILQAWENVENTLKFVIDQGEVMVGSPANVMTATRALHQHGFIDENTRRAIDLLRTVRNTVAHGGGSLDAGSAEGYLRNAQRIINLLLQNKDLQRTKRPG